MVFGLSCELTDRSSDRKRPSKQTRKIDLTRKSHHPCSFQNLPWSQTTIAVSQIYADSIIPQAQAAIIRRERQQLKNSVEVVAPIPPATAKDEAEQPWIYGVAMWRGVDPQTDNFTVFLTGFSSAYRKVTGPDGVDRIERKTIVQEYQRPGDQFDEKEVEFRPVDRPQWIYRPDAGEQQPAATS